MGFLEESLDFPGDYQPFISRLPGSPSNYPTIGSAPPTGSYRSFYPNVHQDFKHASLEYKAGDFVRYTHVARLI